MKKSNTKHTLVLTLCFLAISFVPFIGFAQVKPKFQPNYDAKTIRFGYFIGFANTHFDVRLKPSFTATGDPIAVTSPYSTSIRAGAMINYYINDRFDVRFSPLNLNIISRDLVYVDNSGQIQELNGTDKSWLEIPFHVKYKSQRRHNSRMYMFAGTRFGFETNITTKKGGGTSNSASMKTGDLQLEYGMGLEFFREYFKVTPELHFSHGLFNMKGKDNPYPFLDHVKSLKTHSVSLLILFQ